MLLENVRKLTSFLKFLKKFLYVLFEIHLSTGFKIIQILTIK